MPSAWFDHVMFLYRLTQAGYPFGADDLGIDEWLGIGELKDELEFLREAARIGQ